MARPLPTGAATPETTMAITAVDLGLDGYDLITVPVNLLCEDLAFCFVLGLDILELRFVISLEVGFHVLELALQPFIFFLLFLDLVICG